MRSMLRRQYLPIIYCMSITILSSASVNSQQTKPNKALVLPQFDDSRTFRQDICHVASSQGAGKGTFENDLMGLSLNVWLFDDQYSSIDNDNPGIVQSILDELARRGNFTWRDSFVVDTFDSNNPQNRTFTDLAVWAANTYDIVGTWLVETVERGALGITYPIGWFDSSIIIVGPKLRSQNADVFNVLTLLAPFTPGVWIVLVATLIITGLFLVGFNVGAKAWKGGFAGLKELRITKNILASFLTFTGHVELNIDRRSILIATFSLSFITILIVAAYTANLASFLVVTNMSKLQRSTLQDIVDQQFTLCAITGSSTTTFLRDNFPNARIVGTQSDTEGILGVRNGDCDYTISHADFWREASVRSTTNSDCSLAQFGDPVATQQAGFATRSDAGSKCTSLIRDVLDVHMKAMINDNFIENLWQTRVDQSRDVTCSATDESDTEMLQLNLINMGGIFVLHFIVLGLVWVRSMVKYFLKQRAKKAKEVKDSSSENPETSLRTEDLNACDVKGAIEVIEEQLAYLKKVSYVHETAI